MDPYRQGTTHPALIKIHHNYYTLVYIDNQPVQSLLVVDELCGNEDAETLDTIPSVLYEVIDSASDFCVTSFGCCPESAFRTAWEHITKHEAES